MLVKNRLIKIAIFSATIIVLPLAALALSQFDNFSLQITPGAPGPNQPIRAEVVSYNIDLDGANITWSVGGKTIKTGIGVKTITLTTGAVGSTMRIDVNVVPVGGGSLSQSSTLAANDIDLLWHADSYAPPYYFGKGLLATKSAVTITAIPHLFKNGQRLAPDSLIYEWRLDDWNLPDKSGYNKQSLTFVSDGFSVHREHRIEVTISDRERIVQTAKSLTLAPSNIENIVIYENNPLQGPLYNKALAAINMPPGVEKQFIAVPLNFALGDLDALDYLWSVGGQSEAEVPSKKYLFNFRSLSNAAGNLSVDLQISNKLHPTQSAASQINIAVQ